MLNTNIVPLQGITTICAEKKENYIKIKMTEKEQSVYLCIILFRLVLNIYTIEDLK
jgi:hypothetical protein